MVRGCSLAKTPLTGRPSHEMPEMQRRGHACVTPQTLKHLTRKLDIMGPSGCSLAKALVHRTGVKQSR